MKSLPMAAVESWFPVMTLVIGGALTLASSLLTDLFRDRRRSRRDLEDREIRRREERAVLQRRALLEAQDALNAVLQANMTSNFENQDLDNWLGARGTAQILASRLQDEEARKLIDSFLELAFQHFRLAYRAKREESEQLMREQNVKSIELASRFTSVNQRLGELIRNSESWQ